MRLCSQKEAVRVIYIKASTLQIDCCYCADHEQSEQILAFMPHRLSVSAWIKPSVEGVNVPRKKEWLLNVRLVQISFDTACGKAM